MRVLVTGGSGRAGAYVVQGLAEAGHEVWNVDRQRTDKTPDGAFLHCDLTDAGQVYDAFAQAKPEAVCHVAANPSPSGFIRQEIFANNVQSTYNVLQAAGDSGMVRRFVYASSEMATGWITTSELPPHFPFQRRGPGGYAERLRLE